MWSTTFSVSHRVYIDNNYEIFDITCLGGHYSFDYYMNFGKAAIIPLG